MFLLDTYWTAYHMISLQGIPAQIFRPLDGVRRGYKPSRMYLRHRRLPVKTSRADHAPHEYSVGDTSSILTVFIKGELSPNVLQRPKRMKQFFNLLSETKLPAHKAFGFRAPGISAHVFAPESVHRVRVALEKAPGVAGDHLRADPQGAFCHF